MEQMEKFTVGVIVNNHFGVLYRIAGLFSKRGYNIDSLAVGETENPAYSRITIVCTGGAYMREQVTRQLHKLHDVKRVALFSPGRTISTEHLLLKFRVAEGNRARLSELVSAAGGRVMDFGADFLTAEIAAPSERIAAFIDCVRDFGILETCRSGALAMGHGDESLLTVPGGEEERQRL